MKFKAISLFFNWGKIQSSIDAHINNLSYRHDIPMGMNVPADLADKEGTWQLTKDGYPVAGQLLPEDLGIGSLSPALPLYIALYSVVAVLTGLLPQIGLSIFNPLILAIYFVGFLLFFGRFPTLIFALLTVGASTLVTNFTYALATIGISTSTVLSWLNLIPAVAPLLYLLLTTKKRASALAYQGFTYSNAVMQAPKTKKNVARHVQAITAMNDKSRFIKYGYSKGLFSFNGDSFGADEGLPFGQSTDDMSTNIAMFGEIGTGKTTELRTIFSQIAYKEAQSTAPSGILLLDGKGYLARDCAKKLDVVIDHTTPMNLLSGLDAEMFASILQSMNEPEGGAHGNGKFFSEEARNGVYTAYVFLEVLSNHGLMSFCLTSLKNILNTIFGSNEDDLETFNSLFNLETFNSLLLALPYEETIKPIFKDAVTKLGAIRSENETQQNIKSSIDSWLSPFFQSEKLRHWCDCIESNVNIEDVLYGRRIGVCLPEFDFPVAGKVATALLKRRFYRALQLRGDNWKQNGMSHCFLFIDEAQVVLDSSDLNIVPRGRSLGLVCIFATQNIESYLAKFGKDKAMQMLASFVSIISMRSSEATYDYIRNRIGKDRVWIQNAKSQSISYGLTNTLTLANPVFDPRNPMRGWLKLFSFGVISTLFKKVSHSDKAGQDQLAQKYASLVLSEHPIHILQDKDIQVVQSEKFTAIASVMRGGVPRREIIRTIPLDADFNEIPVTIDEILLKKPVDFGEVL